MNKKEKNIKSILNGYGEFIPIPTELLVNPRYNGMGSSNRVRHNSAILYGLLLLLSKDQNKTDENGKRYVTISGYEIATVVGTTTSSVPTSMLKNLEKFDLIERGEFKPGSPRRIYLKDIKR